MARAVRNAVRVFGVGPYRAAAIAAMHTAVFLGLAHERGGRTGVVLQHDLSRREKWIGGVPASREKAAA